MCECVGAGTAASDREAGRVTREAGYLSPSLACLLACEREERSSGSSVGMALLVRQASAVAVRQPTSHRKPFILQTPFPAYVSVGGSAALLHSIACGRGRQDESRHEERRGLRVHCDKKLLVTRDQRVCVSQRRKRVKIERNRDSQEEGSRSSMTARGRQTLHSPTPSRAHKGESSQSRVAMSQLV